MYVNMEVSGRGYTYNELGVTYVQIQWGIYMYVLHRVDIRVVKNARRDLCQAVEQDNKCGKGFIVEQGWERIDPSTKLYNMTQSNTIHCLQCHGNSFHPLPTYNTVIWLWRRAAETIFFVSRFSVYRFMFSFSLYFVFSIFTFSFSQYLFFRFLSSSLFTFFYLYFVLLPMFLFRVFSY